MPDLSVVTKLPEFKDRMGADWQQQYDAKHHLCYLFEYNGCAYRAYPLDDIDHNYVGRIQRC